jgi:hypothetical protein
MECEAPQRVYFEIAVSNFVYTFPSLMKYVILIIFNMMIYMI